MDIRRQKWALLFVAAIAVASMVTVVYLSRYSDRGPTSEEFRVYSALLDRVRADEHVDMAVLHLWDRRLNCPILNMTTAFRPNYDPIDFNHHRTL